MRSLKVTHLPIPQAQCPAPMWATASRQQLGPTHHGVSACPPFWGPAVHPTGRASTAQDHGAADGGRGPPQVQCLWAIGVQAPPPEQQEPRRGELEAAQG